jgi:hypothetical protein
MQVKFGAWSGGDSANAPGTIEWSRGPTDYSKGPYTMQVRSLMVQDYSTGTQYVYGDQTGTSKSIKAVGGTVFSGGNKPVANAPTVTAMATGQPIPFNTPRETDTYIRPSVYPWVPGTTSAAPQPTFANYPGLPAGWSVSDSGKVVPPSSAPVSKLLLPRSSATPPFEIKANMPQMSPAASSTPLPAASPSVSFGDLKPSVVTGYDDRGFTTIRTLYPSTTPASTPSTANRLQNNAATPAAPAANISGKRAVSWTAFIVATFLGLVVL